MAEKYTGNSSAAFPAPPDDDLGIWGVDRNAVKLLLPTGGDGFNVENVVNAVYRPVANLLTRVKQKVAFHDLTNDFTKRVTIDTVAAGTNALKVTGGFETDTFSTTGNTTVGGTLDVTGTTTVGGSLGVTNNAAVGGTLSVTGAVTGASFSHNAPQARYAYVDASEMQVDATNGYTRASQQFIRTYISATGTTGPARVSMRIRAPRGATIVGLELLASNTLVSAVDAKVVFTRIQDAGSTPTWTTLSTGGVPGVAVSIVPSTAGSDPLGEPSPTWAAVPLIATPGTVPMNGYLHLDITFPSSNTSVKLYSVRMNYSYTSIAGET